MDSTADASSFVSGTTSPLTEFENKTFLAFLRTFRLAFAFNTSSVETVIANKDFEFEGKSYPARLRMLNEPSDIKDTINAVKIFVQSGHTNQTDRPDALVAAMLLIIGHLYENRQDVGQHKTHATPLASRYLMEPYRLKSFA